MGKQVFVKRSRMPVSATELYRWHSRPGAFVRLGPPWEDVELVTPAAPLIPGASQTMKIRRGPLSLRWHAEIEAVNQDESFVDVQRSGPFRSWRHQHSMVSESDTSSFLEDRVEYSLPLDPIASWFAGWMVRSDLERMFAYRHAVTLHDLERHAVMTDTQAKTIVLSGSSGLVGSALTSFLTCGGHTVRKLVRGQPGVGDEFEWNPLESTVDAAAIEGADAVIHLAGENIAAGRWTASQKKKILESRVRGTSAIAKAVEKADSKPRVVLTASAIGYYGDRQDELLDEQSSQGSGFLAEVCRDWEASAPQLEGVRTAHTRFGVILSPAGGALGKMLLPFKLGAGGRLGSGKQWMSWIALDDVIGALHHALFNEELSGPVNFVAPNPVTNAEFTSVLGKVLRRPTILPAPGFAMRLALGEMAQELLLSGQRVQPKRLLESGFSFAYPDLENALRHVLGRR